jgi:hypothetical protein
MASTWEVGAEGRGVIMVVVGEEEGGGEVAGEAGTGAMDGGVVGVGEGEGGLEGSDHLFLFLRRVTDCMDWYLIRWLGMIATMAYLTGESGFSSTELIPGTIKS